MWSNDNNSPNKGLVSKVTDEMTSDLREAELNTARIAKLRARKKTQLKEFRWTTREDRGVLFHVAFYQMM